MKKITLNNYFLFVFLITIPWIVVLMFNLYKIETINYFFEMNEVIIKVVFLFVSVIGCLVMFLRILRDKLVNRISKIIFLLLDFIFFCLTLVSIWFILALRNGVGL